MSNRNMVLCDEVKWSSVRDIIKSIRDINREDDEQDKKLREYTRQPVELVINTPGGYLDSGTALIGAIQTSRTPVHTIVYGTAYSMGIFILAAGHKRFMHSMSTLMFHECSSWTFGKMEENKRHQSELQKRWDKLKQFLVNRTDITYEKLKQAEEQLLDWFIDADEALKLKIVDEVI